MPEIKQLAIVLILMVGWMIQSGCKQEKTTGEMHPGELQDASGILTFERTSFDLGRIQQGETVGYNFQFTNTGSGTVLIIDAKASCGCTVPRYSRKPIEPGGTGSVEVMFDSSGRIGRQDKTVTISTNGEPSVVRLNIRAEIVNPST